LVKLRLKTTTRDNQALNNVIHTKELHLLLGLNMQQSLAVKVERQQ